MKEAKRVYLTKEEFNMIASSKLGEGYDAIVYRGINGTVYKIYKYDNNEDIIDKATEKQETVKLTNLPQAAIYIDNKFSGYVLKRVRGLDLHHAWFLLSKKNKIKVLKELLIKVRELTDNYIYPTDIANSPLVGKHSNVKVDYKIHPQIIDLDGISTSYSDKEDKCLLSDTYCGLSLLFLELILGPDLFEDIDNLNIPYIQKLLIEANIEDDIAKRLSNLEGTYEDINKLLLTFSKK